MLKEQFPKEKYVPLNNHPHLVGRITLIKAQKHFVSEIDLIFKEGHKIYMHVGRYESHEEEQECWDWSIQKLSDFLKGT
jgi:hypothetical protein